MSPLEADWGKETAKDWRVSSLMRDSLAAAFNARVAWAGGRARIGRTAPRECSRLVPVRASRSRRNARAPSAVLAPLNASLNALGGASAGGTAPTGRLQGSPRRENYSEGLGS